MANPKSQPVLISLAWLSCNLNDFPCIVLSVVDKANLHSIQYIKFSFSSIDTLILYLRILARNVKSYSLDNLKKNVFPATLVYEENFNSLDTFCALYVGNNIQWPYKDYCASFLIDATEV